ncbi:hypothetical protein ONE63_008119 [Megalurothrips usitatus]|uniref:Uncharacterized protein n=1 Tax=Megalurothrips usitatus TaxID=439358 RepID=A0AAV7XSP9_9NEOP|nr:hypothetical protein ONE63_008119 [Megalurothrips usitatus]
MVKTRGGVRQRPGRNRTKSAPRAVVRKNHKNLVKRDCQRQSLLKFISTTPVKVEPVDDEIRACPVDEAPAVPKPSSEQLVDRFITEAADHCDQAADVIVHAEQGQDDLQDVMDVINEQPEAVLDEMTVRASKKIAEEALSTAAAESQRKRMHREDGSEEELETVAAAPLAPSRRLLFADRPMKAKAPPAAEDQVQSQEVLAETPNRTQEKQDADTSDERSTPGRAKQNKTEDNLTDEGESSPNNAEDNSPGALGLKTHCANDHELLKIFTTQERKASEKATDPKTATNNMAGFVSRVIGYGEYFTDKGIYDDVLKGIAELFELTDEAEKWIISLITGRYDAHVSKLYNAAVRYIAVLLVWKEAIKNSTARFPFASAVQPLPSLEAVEAKCVQYTTHDTKNFTLSSKRYAKIIEQLTLNLKRSTFQWLHRRIVKKKNQS